MENMNLKPYLEQMQAIQRDTYGILHTIVNTSDLSVYISVFEYDYEKVEAEKGDYQLETFSVYTFYDKDENDAVMKELNKFVSRQLAKHKGNG